MQIIYQIHNLFGERVLPVLVVAALVWLAVSWRPAATGKHVAARVLPILIDLHVTLGLIMFILGTATGRVDYLAFPFLLHPVLGLVTAGYGHVAVRGVPFRRFGRWSVVASMALLLLLILLNIVLAKTRG
jgi:hypothetical protein